MTVQGKSGRWQGTKSSRAGVRQWHEGRLIRWGGLTEHMCWRVLVWEEQGQILGCSGVIGMMSLRRRLGQGPKLEAEAGIQVRIEGDAFDSCLGDRSKACWLTRGRGREGKGGVQGFLPSCSNLRMWTILVFLLKLLYSNWWEQHWGTPSRFHFHFIPFHFNVIGAHLWALGRYKQCVGGRTLAGPSP